MDGRPERGRRHLDGCGATTRDPLWVGLNHTSGAESSPVVANGVVYVGKGLATFVDAGTFAFDGATHAG